MALRNRTLYIQKYPELKELPQHMKYNFLDYKSLEPTIINSSLSTLEIKKGFRVLRCNKQALGWSVTDLKGISLACCMHTIKLEEEFRPVVQLQRRVNPIMKEVMRQKRL